MLAAIAISALLSVTPVSETATISDQKPTPVSSFSAPTQMLTQDEIDAMAEEYPFLYDWRQSQIFYLFFFNVHSSTGPGSRISIEGVDNWA